MDENISTFAAITGATPEVAQGFLQITNGDVERAVGLYFENPDLASGVGAGVSGTSTTPTTSTSRRPNVGREDESGVIHISDDDDDGDDDMNVDDDNDAAVQHAANMAQEEEDAAMAKRLQEELYGSGTGPGASEDVRAPIARTTETLVAPDAAWGDGGIDDDTTQRLLEHLRTRRRAPGKQHNSPETHTCGQISN